MDWSGAGRILTKLAGMFQSLRGFGVDWSRGQVESFHRLNRFNP
ncbi:hypothetical protein GFS31_43770 (plasmid) [Leptolyngbya sp. BL0902]|nr:hypothetical protein GFS31_43770 [Leptolyngbya sp. BL0902]